MADPAFLLTWNPIETPNDRHADEVAQTKAGEIVSGNWSTGNSKAIKAGQRVYFLRQVVDRGIVGSGVTTSDVWIGKNWKDGRKKARYVDIAWETLLLPHEGLPTDTLVEELPDFPWNNLQASGCSVPEHYVEPLNKLWTAHLHRLGRDQLFQVGQAYTRSDIYRILKLRRDQQGGDWATGMHRHGDDWFIFPTVGAAARTGHYYGNYWDGDELVWRGKTGSKLTQPTIRSLLKPTGHIYIFTRGRDRDPFTYEGDARAKSSQDTIPVTIRWHFPGKAERRVERLANELSDAETLMEGAAKTILVNAYERNPAARRKCLEYYGYDCQVCGFDFADFYSPLVEDYIHVHHVKDLASIGKEYEVDPVADLRPVCPNCHAMLHLTRPAMAIEALKSIVHQRRANQ